MGQGLPCPIMLPGRLLAEAHDAHSVEITAAALLQQRLPGRFSRCDRSAFGRTTPLAAGECKRCAACIAERFNQRRVFDFLGHFDDP